MVLLCFYYGSGCFRYGFVMGLLWLCNGFVSVLCDVVMVCYVFDMNLLRFCHGFVIPCTGFVSVL